MNLLVSLVSVKLYYSKGMGKGGLAERAGWREVGIKRGIYFGEIEGKVRKGG